MGLLPWDHFHAMGKHDLTIEFEEALEAFCPDEMVNPVAVVLPHFFDRYGIECRPEGRGLVGFGGGAGEGGGAEDVAEEAEAVGELEMEQADFLRVGDGDEEFLLDFAHGALPGGLTGIDLPARAVDFAGSEAAFLADKQDFAITNDEEKRGAERRLPGGPVGIQSGEGGWGGSIHS